MEFRLFITIALLVVSVPAPASGDTTGKVNQSVSTAAPVPTAPGRPATRNWKEQTEATCGMACRYHRANDNLTMQALYLVTKVQKIDDAVANDKDGEARTALGAFCKSENEATADCVKRYKAFQSVGLLDIRQAIGKNEDTIARLTQGRKADGTVEGVALVYETGEENVPYVPDVLTLSELEQSYLDGKLKNHGKTYSREEIRKWSESLVVNDPKAKYLQFRGKASVGNPYQEAKSSYSLYLENRDENGNSAGADAKAVALYNQSKPTIEEFAKDSKKEIGDGKIKVIAPTKNLAKDDRVSYEAFIQARSVVNGRIEADTKRTDETENDRKVASDKDPKAKPSPIPSGAPTPVAGTNLGVSRDVKITGDSVRRQPTAIRTYGPDEKVARPPELKNSRYIKYDLGDILKDAESLAK